LTELEEFGSMGPQEKGPAMKPVLELLTWKHRFGNPSQVHMAGSPSAIRVSRGIYASA